MTPDALVSELRDVFRVDQGETLHPRHPKYLGNLAADAIGRLTRELAEARSLYAAQTALSQLNHDACEEAETALKQSEAALSAARAELARVRLKYENLRFAGPLLAQRAAEIKGRRDE